MTHLSADDLDAAAAQGIVTAEQAAALRTFAASREKDRIARLGHEERFRFMRGFNDFFFAIGVLLFGVGLWVFTSETIIGNVIAAAIIWGLAELLVRRMRLVLPGILLACFFVAFVFRAVPFDHLFSITPPRPGRGAPTNWVQGLFGLQTSAPIAIGIRALTTAIAAAAYYARFRLPFALLPIAGALVLAVTQAAGFWLGWSILNPTLLTCGIVVFAAAMAFDLTDRERLTLRADCAFWLHLLAAPLIVHSLISFVTPAITQMTNDVAVAIVGIVACLAVVAILIDRRALLVSALIYVGIVIGYVLTGGGAWLASDRTFVFSATILILGICVIALGVGWLPLRRRLLRMLPSGMSNRLPPAVAAA